VHISALKIRADTEAVTVEAVTPSAVEVSVVERRGGVVAKAAGKGGEAIRLVVPEPHLWSPSDPYLYDVVVTAGKDSVKAYAGMRSFGLQNVQVGGRATTVSALNSKRIFSAGFLDQSWWPDGLYTAPTDEALAFDVQAVKTFGLNMIRLHQKVNSERWYWHADRLGVLIFQDVPQKYGHASATTVPLYLDDLRALVTGPRANHPCIVQYETFNEEDCWSVFTDKTTPVEAVVNLTRKLDPTRLVDTDSGGGANFQQALRGKAHKHFGDVNDIHSYPYPRKVQPRDDPVQYAMIGEFGGLGAFVEGKEWVPGKCTAYLNSHSSQQMANTYVNMTLEIQPEVSASVYTQTTDLELECDGFLNFDRTNKFDAEQTSAIRNANMQLIASHSGSDSGLLMSVPRSLHI
jgi:hypothetical protein